MRSTFQDRTHPDRLSHILSWSPDQLSTLLLTARAWHSSQLSNTDRYLFHPELVISPISQCPVFPNNINNVNIISFIRRCKSGLGRGGGERFKMGPIQRKLQERRDAQR